MNAEKQKLRDHGWIELSNSSNFTAYTQSLSQTRLKQESGPPLTDLFLARARCLSAGLRYLRLTRLPRHDRGPVPGGNRSAASCLCTVLRRALSTTRRDRLVQLPLKKWQIRIFYWRPIHHGSLLRFLSHVFFQSSVVRLRSSRS